MRMTGNLNFSKDLTNLSQFLQRTTESKSASQLTSAMKYTSLSFNAVLFNLQTSSNNSESTPAPSVDKNTTKSAGETSSFVSAQTTTTETQTPRSTETDRVYKPQPTEVRQDTKYAETSGSTSVSHKGETSTQANSQTFSQETKQEEVSEGEETEVSKEETRTDGREKTAQEGQNKKKESLSTAEETKSAETEEVMAQIKAIKVSATLTTNGTVSANLLKKLGKEITKILEDDSTSMKEKADKLLMVLSDLGLSQETVLHDLQLGSVDELAAQGDLMKTLMSRLASFLQKVGENQSGDEKSSLQETQSVMTTETEGVLMTAVSGEDQTTASVESLSKDSDRKGQIDELVNAILRRVQRQLTGKDETESEQKAQTSGVASEGGEDQEAALAKVKAQRTEASERKDTKASDSTKKIDLLQQNQTGEGALNKLGVETESARVTARIKVTREGDSAYQMQNSSSSSNSSIKATASSSGNASLAFSNYEQNASPKQLANQLQAQTRSQSTQEFLKQYEVFDQIVRQAKISVSEGKSEATIQLKPEHLGRVQLKMTVENNTVVARFTADNPAVVQTLDQNMENLKKSLGELGLSVSNLEVALTGGEANFGNGEKNGNEASSGNYSGVGPAEEEDEDSLFAFDDMGVMPVESWRTDSTVAYVA